MAGVSMPREGIGGRVYSADTIRKYSAQGSYAEAFAATDAWIDESVALLFGIAFSQVSPSIIARRLIQSGKSGISMSMLYSMRDYVEESPLFSENKDFQKNFKKALRGVEAFKSWRNLVVHNYGYRKLAILRQHKESVGHSQYLQNEKKFNDESERILDLHLNEGMSCVKSLQDLYRETARIQK
jgi:hypothetical protein